MPRNRSVVSHYIVHASAMIAGGGRIADTQELAGTLGLADKYLNEAKNKLDRTKKVDPQAIAAQITSRPF